MNREQLKRLERQLWSAADNLRANSGLKSNQYSTPILGLIFLRFADNIYRRSEAAINAEFQKLKGTRREEPINKIATAKCGFYPLLSPRSDIIVLVDEAHRTQYEDLAQNMRAGLKNAQFLAFTGTPLLGRDRKTNQWFGDYVSEYNFRQAIDDESTVPLFHQKRVPEVLIQNDDLTEDLLKIFDEEEIDGLQQEKLTGFDAPTVSTLYLDKPMRDHSLMQTTVSEKAR